MSWRAPPPAPLAHSLHSSMACTHLERLARLARVHRAPRHVPAAHAALAAAALALVVDVPAHTFMQPCSRHVRGACSAGKGGGMQRVGRGGGYRWRILGMQAHASAANEAGSAGSAYHITAQRGAPACPWPPQACRLLGVDREDGAAHKAALQQRHAVVPAAQRAGQGGAGQEATRGLGLCSLAKHRRETRMTLQQPLPSGSAGGASVAQWGLLWRVQHPCSIITQAASTEACCVARGAWWRVRRPAGTHQMRSKVARLMVCAGASGCTPDLKRISAR